MDTIAVLFDIDGLMLDTERMALTAWARALAERGYQLDDPTALSLLGLTVQDTAKVLEGFFGQSWPYQEVYARRNVLYNADIDANGFPIKQGLMELLDFLEANHVLKAVASSTPCWFASRKLEKTGLGQRFQAVICGDMVSRGKPAPDLFLEAARLIKIDPGRCVVLEDSEAGIIAAHAAGMVPVMVPDMKQPSPEIQALAYRVLPSLQEAIPLIAEFLGHGLPD
jgi:HAD superfamily hydrolase (TIGR01509 family)